MWNCKFILYCIQTGNTEVTRLMLESGARTDTVNSVGRNAAQMAGFVGNVLNWCREQYRNTASAHIKILLNWCSFNYNVLTRQRKAWLPLAGGQSWPWPLTLWPKINRVPPLIIHNLHVKFESDRAKTVVCILPTRSYTQSAKVDLDLWPRDPKLIGFLLWSSTTYMWSLKVIG